MQMKFRNEGRLHPYYIIFNPLPSQASSTTKKGALLLLLLLLFVIFGVRSLNHVAHYENCIIL